MPDVKQPACLSTNIFRKLNAINHSDFDIEEPPFKYFIPSNWRKAFFKKPFTINLSCTFPKKWHSTFDFIRNPHMLQSCYLLNN